MKKNILILVLILGLFTILYVSNEAVQNRHINDAINLANLSTPFPTPTSTVVPTVEPTPEVTPELATPTPISTPIPIVKKPPVQTNILTHRTFITSRGNISRKYIVYNDLDRYKKYNMVATAYDLTVESCGKEKGHPAYGITASGFKAQINRTVAVDPRVIPLGSVLYIKFPTPYSHMNGMYVADDTGGAIKGNKVDIFFGEDVSPQTVRNFGRRNVEVYLIGR